MSDVAVVHLDLGSKGGGEAVTMNVIELLQPDHDVSLITVTHPNIAELNSYFNTAVDDDELEVIVAGRLAPALHSKYGVRYYVFQNALLGRYARRKSDSFDLFISTINELGLPPGSIEYVHFPFDWTVSLTNRNDIFHPGISDGSLYEKLCVRTAAVSESDIKKNCIFANSEWTADCFERAYGTRPDVLYPPVDLEEFADVPWEEREIGFVTIGRVERSKRIVEMIRIVESLRERGHDVHLHVVGPAYNQEYVAMVESMAESRDFVVLEGEISRSALVRLIVTHRYGLHGKEHEHFGMAIAELAAGGTIPFVPSTGGQHTIVSDDDRLLYSSGTEAVDKIDRVLSSESLQQELRFGHHEIERRFGRERFKEQFRVSINTALELPDSGSQLVRPATGDAPLAED